LHPTSSRAKNESVLGPYHPGVDCLVLIASAPDIYNYDAHGTMHVIRINTFF
jgi:hypothetical protein